MDILVFNTTELGTSVKIDPQASVKGHDFIWVDSTRDELESNPSAWLQAVIQATGICIDEYHMKDILNNQHPSYFDLTNDYELLIFRKLTSQHRNQPILSPAEIITQPVALVISERALVTVRDAHSQTFDTFRQRLLQQTPDAKSRSMRLPTSSFDLTLRIINSMVDRYLDLRLPLAQRIDYWQKLLLESNHRFNQWHALFEDRLAMSNLENICEEQLDALQELRDSFLDQQGGPRYADLESNQRRDLMMVRINDLMEHVKRVQVHVSRLDQALKSAIDLHFSSISNQTNETMRFLAIITSIFAPLTLLTGIYGMNFDMIPGLHNPDGFWLMMAAMILTTVLLLTFFQRRRMVGRGEKSVLKLMARELLSKEPPH